MRILLVEPDRPAADVFEAALKADGHAVYWTNSGEEAVSMSSVYDFDAILLANELPDVYTFEVINSIRLAKNPVPIIVLALHQSLEDRVKCLNLGADDYLAKPVHTDELLARVKTVVRRSKGHMTSKIRVGGLEVDLDQQEITLNGAHVRLTRSEFKVIECMALRRNTTVTKEMLLDYLYGGMAEEPEMKIVDVFVCKLRKKLESAGAGRLVETVWGRGYVLREPRAVAA